MYPQGQIGVKYNSKPTSMEEEKLLLPEILVRIEEICKEQGRVFSGCTHSVDLMTTFNWSDTLEEGDFWLALYYGDFTGFYDRYPDGFSLDNVFKI